MREQVAAVHAKVGGLSAALVRLDDRVSKQHGNPYAPRAIAFRRMIEMSSLLRQRRGLKLTRLAVGYESSLNSWIALTDDA